MASSIVHLAITNELSKQVSFKDLNRLRFGAIVVDAGAGGNEFGNAHLKVNVLMTKRRPTILINSGSCLGNVCFRMICIWGIIFIWFRMLYTDNLCMIGITGIQQFPEM